MTHILKSPSGNIEIVMGKVLTDEQLKALKWACLHSSGEEKMSYLNMGQIAQFGEYMIKEAAEYRSGHSMQFTIMKYFVMSTLIQN